MLHTFSYTSSSYHSLYFSLCSTCSMTMMTIALHLSQWDLATGSCTKTIEEAHTMNIAAVAVNINDTSIVYSGSRDYGVKGWEMETGKMIAQFSAPRNIVTTMEYASDNASSLLFQGSEDLCVRAWDTKSSSSQPALHITGYVYFPTSMTVHPGLFSCFASFLCVSHQLITLSTVSTHP